MTNKNLKTTSSGFKYSINEKVKTDWFFLKSVRDLQEKPTDTNLIETVFVKLISKEGFESLTKHILKKNDGYCPVEELMKELKEIIDGENKVKK